MSSRRQDGICKSEGSAAQVATGLWIIRIGESERIMLESKDFIFLREVFYSTWDFCKEIIVLRDNDLYIFASRSLGRLSSNFIYKVIYVGVK